MDDIFFFVWMKLSSYGDLGIHRLILQCPNHVLEILYFIASILYKFIENLIFNKFFVKEGWMRSCLNKIMIPKHFDYLEFRIFSVEQWSERTIDCCSLDW